MTSTAQRPLAVVAMSGGVDSAVAAALLREAGRWEVAGITLRLADDPGLASVPRKAPTCCAPDDIADARRVADRLGIAWYVSNYRDVFEQEVMDPFARAYAAGRTPNPCVWCNSRVKFDPLLRRARALGAEVLATGHYARIVDGPHGPRLLRARYLEKDQSYFLYGLDREALRTVRFPLGELTKPEVREKARALGLPVADKHESQEICFVSGDYADWVEGRLGPRPGGDIVDREGNVLGRHRGVHRYTVGQRKGLGLSGRDPLYVLGVDAERNEVRVGSREDLQRRTLILEDLNWIAPPPAPDRALTVRVRYRHAGVPGRVLESGPERARVRLDEPVTGAAPGQAVVIYDEEEVLGGGTLVEALG